MIRVDPGKERIPVFPHHGPRRARALLTALSVPQVIVAAILLPALIVPAAAAGFPPGIDPDLLLADVAFFASAECAGRLPGTPGYERAAKHAAAVFAGLGLQPGGDRDRGGNEGGGLKDGGDLRGWFQHLPMELNVVRRCAVTLTGNGGQGMDLELGRDCACRGFTGSGQADAPVVFVGYGLSLPERGYDDYAGFDVGGKIVLAFKQAPPWQPDDGQGWQGMDLPRLKARTARDRGAAALLLISRPNDEDPQPVIASVLHGPGEHVPDLPAVQIALDAAGRLCPGGLPELRALQAVIDSTRAPASCPLAGRARVDVRADYDPQADAYNVVAVLPGSDPGLEDECVIVGGHLDHVGAQGDVFWPGANDNASGAAAVLGIARAFAAADAPPRRTVVFVLFAGEEQGLHGARFFAEHPVLPLARAAAMLNLDCVAHGDSIQLGGGKTQPRLWGMARAIDARHAALTVAETWPGGGADAAPFHDAGVPTLYFASRPSYAHLHRTSDTVATLNPGLLADVAALAYRTAAAVGQGEYNREGIGGMAGPE